MRDAGPGYSVSPRKYVRSAAFLTEMRTPRVRLANAATAACAIASVSACSPVPSLPPAPAQPPPDTGYVSNLPPYRIQVGDVLGIRLMLNPELNEEVTVRPDGHISTTVVHDAPAYGRTVSDVATILTKGYSEELSKPRLSVVVRSFAPTRIYVGGEVNNPGEFITVGPNLTLSQAIARAGGLKTM